MENKYYPTVGLEIHAELNTRTKMFCVCKNDPDEKKPNVNICPVCTAHPGALPVINKKAIENVIKVGLAIGGEIADFTEFDRKNYFYPDIPKGYQISQYKFPIVSGGHLSDFDITRVHLEEDTANNKHNRGDFSLIDFNRAGVPLLELVTEPRTFEARGDAAQNSAKFGKELQLILQFLGVSNANMEKGEMRVEANISISVDSKILGTKVEVKNLNSFRSVERAILFELGRMASLLDQGKGIDIVQETRGWDEEKQNTFSQRKKESSQDYRYFPEPDLPKMKLYEAFDLAKIKSELPELPFEMRGRFKNDYGIKDEDIESYINDGELRDYFKKAAETLLPNRDNIILASNLISNDLIGSGKKVSEFIDADLLSEAVIMISKGELSSRAAKDILLTGNNFPKAQTVHDYAVQYNLLQKSDTKALEEFAKKIIDGNPKVVADYKEGKENALMSLVGQIMKETKGSANPALARQIFIDLLK